MRIDTERKKRTLDSCFAATDTFQDWAPAEVFRWNNAIINLENRDDQAGRPLLFDNLEAHRLSDRQSLPYWLLTSFQLPRILKRLKNKPKIDLSLIYYTLKSQGRQKGTRKKDKGIQRAHQCDTSWNLNVSLKARSSKFLSCIEGAWPIPRSV